MIKRFLAWYFGTDVQRYSDGRTVFGKKLWGVIYPQCIQCHHSLAEVDEDRCSACLDDGFFSDEGII